MTVDNYSKLMFAVLERAWKDRKRRPNLMFTEFKRRFPGNRPDVPSTVLWVAEFIEKHDIAGYCLSVLDRDLAFERRNKWILKFLII